MEVVVGGSSNGGMLYHEVQESKLCAVHCVNTVLQGPYFSEFDLAALASDLDSKERQMMLEGESVTDDFLRFDSEESHNVSMDGDFSIQVLQKALEVWDLQVIPLNCPVAEPAQVDPELENAFICHLQDHWFSIRKVNGEWYNFNSLYAAPEHLSRFYLSAYLDSLKGSGWSIFLVRGSFPKECSISTSDASGFGQWLTPEDAQRITKSFNATQSGTRSAPTPTPPVADSYQPCREERSLSDMENDDLQAAIAASLMDSAPPAFTAENVNVIPPPAPASIAASLVDSGPPPFTAENVNVIPPAPAATTTTTITTEVLPEDKEPNSSSENTLPSR